VGRARKTISARTDSAACSPEQIRSSAAATSRAVAVAAVGTARRLERRGCRGDDRLRAGGGAALARPAVAEASPGGDGPAEYGARRRLDGDARVDLLGAADRSADGDDAAGAARGDAGAGARRRPHGDLDGAIAGGGDAALRGAARRVGGADAGAR